MPVLRRSQPTRKTVAVDDADVVRGEYELALKALSDHMGRMWLRFNFFLTLVSSLVAGLIFTSDNGTFTDSALYFLIAEAVLSLVWWVFGAQDRYLVDAYRKAIAASWGRHQQNFPEALGGLSYAGDVSRSGLDFHNVAEWRWSPVSITRLPAIFPLVLFVFWLAMIAVFLAAHG